MGVKLPGNSSFLVQDLLDELKLLAETAGAEVVDIVVQERKRLDPAFFIGKGKVKEVKEIAQREEANLVIFDDDLTPAQMWNLEKEIDLKIIDRSCLILDIFAKRAKTKEAWICSPTSSTRTVRWSAIFRCIARIFPPWNTYSPSPYSVNKATAWGTWEKARAVPVPT